MPPTGPFDPLVVLADLLAVGRLGALIQPIPGSFHPGTIHAIPLPCFPLTAMAAAKTIILGCGNAHLK
ncbi:MAG TPA: hypothetical protein VMV05_12255 [bacterium]|nr:hypothetical protein [bacterium]